MTPTLLIFILLLLLPPYHHQLLTKYTVSEQKMTQEEEKKIVAIQEALMVGVTQVFQPNSPLAKIKGVLIDAPMVYYKRILHEEPVVNLGYGNSYILKTGSLKDRILANLRQTRHQVTFDASGRKWLEEAKKELSHLYAGWSTGGKKVAVPSGRRPTSAGTAEDGDESDARQILLSTGQLNVRIGDGNEAVEESKIKTTGQVDPIGTAKNVIYGVVILLMAILLNGTIILVLRRRRQVMKTQTGSTRRRGSKRKRSC